MKRILRTLIAVALIPGTALAENVYRWVDNDGKVNFGRTLPPEYANMPYQILNDAGVVIERVDDPMARQTTKPEEKADEKLAPLFTEDEVRLRTDRLLVLKYQSAEDIQNAMELELAQLDFDARLIEQSQASTMQAMAGQVHSAADRQRAGLPNDAEADQTIESLRNRLRRSENSLAELKNREAKIRVSFGKEVERFHFLENGGKPGVIVPEPDTAGTDS